MYATVTTTCTVPLEHLEATICQGAANLTAAEHGWLLSVAEFDRRRGWERWQCHSAAQWLSWQVGLDMRAAREKVRVGRALEVFPLISAAMADGRLSYSKVRAITRIATPATERALVEMALAGTTNHVERIVSSYRRAAPAPEQLQAAQWARRGLQHEVQPDGTVRISLVLPPEQAVTFLSAIEQFTPASEPLADGSREPRAVRRADGAAQMAATAHAAANGEPTSAPRYLVTLHADLDALTRGEGECAVSSDGDSCEPPIGVANSTALRMLCDCDVQTVFERHGRVVGISDRSSVITGKLRRLVLARDRHCQFPGCHRATGLDVHHIRHREHGGTNHPANLTLLCRFHHHRLHEGGWTIERRDEALRFVAPDGRVAEAGAPAPHGDAATVHGHQRTAADGRCQWRGERLDVNDALAALFSREQSATRWQPKTP
jgi:hypothetical protein